MRQASGKILLATLLAAVGLGLIAALLWSDAVRGTIAGWLGPPRVELAESFGDESGGATFDHSRFDTLLAGHVDADGFVDYAGLTTEVAELDAYIASLADAPLEELGRDERLALLINAYNAFTLRLILDHYPLASIKDIPAARRWEDARWRLGGQAHSLDQIEHRLIRPNFREPRIHFALVCAAVGCPPLRAEAYSGARLEEQLDEQARYTHAHDRWLRYRPRGATIELTSLYDWYRGDFEQVAGSILAYAARYDERLARDLAEGHQPRVRFLDYDWSLNEQ
jgi:hypothetical protein